MHNHHVVLTVPRSKGFWDEGCLALLLVLSVAQIGYCFAAATVPKPAPKLTLAAPVSQAGIL
jgi:hypothetical protein